MPEQCLFQPTNQALESARKFWPMIAAPAVPGAEPGDVVAFLFSPAAAGLAGQTLTVDGGLWM